MELPHHCCMVLLPTATDAIAICDLYEHLHGAEKLRFG